MINRPDGFHAFIALFLLVPLFLPGTADAQDVNTVVDGMRSVYQKQLEHVNTYIVETNQYKTYVKKVSKDGEATYTMKTDMKNGGTSPLSANTPASASPYGVDFDALRKHATHEGTATVDGSTVDVLRVDEPQKVMKSRKQISGSLNRARYLIDRKRHVPVRVIVKAQQKGRGEEPRTSTITVDLKDYRDVDGLVYPHRTEITYDLGMSEEQKQQMKQAIERIKNMPEKQREKMKKMMGSNFEKLQRMMSDEPIVINVTQLKVNVDLPEGVFPEETKPAED